MGKFPLNDSIRKMVAKHFHKRQVTLTEDGILEAIKSPRSKWDVYFGVIALRDVGSSRCIPALKKLLHFPMQDVKDCSLLTIAHIAGSSETSFFIEALAGKRTKKAYPMLAIEAVADERAVPAVLGFLKGSAHKLARSKSGEAADAFVSGIKYLARIDAKRPEFQSIFSELPKVWSVLPEHLQRQLRVALPSKTFSV